MLLNFRTAEPADGGREWRPGFEDWKFNGGADINVGSERGRGWLRLKFRDALKRKRQGGSAHPARSFVKRGVDIVLASTMLVALAPVLLSLAAAVRIDRGPALFRHRRIGANGRPFYCLKFRSMCVDAETRLKDYLLKNPEAQVEWDRDFKLKSDPRITRLGNLMRRTSLDELPQLINVLKGDMSLVGPRPIVPAEIPRYGDSFSAYLRCRPGITGLWQVSGRNDVDYGTRVELDTRYASDWTIITDAKILLRTIAVVFRRSGAY
jgi:Undecaprenyl-phosphate galactose phosphotransferase WbaP